MRLWSIHPENLDPKGLVALWRETLLAREVLKGKTKGYKHHPQLLRFKNFKDPLYAIESYLYYVYLEAKKRGYSFDKKKVRVKKPLYRIIPVTSGQIKFESLHLCKKLKKRDPEKYRLLYKKKTISLHPLFYLVNGKIERWEKIK